MHGQIKKISYVSIIIASSTQHILGGKCLVCVPLCRYDFFMNAIGFINLSFTIISCHPCDAHKPFAPMIVLAFLVSL